ncbi:MAG: hypothetical protein NTW25_04905 [Candidatus Kapabacteria bacterium]|nr:hypothetical protein [Candidatus Kapabacteria bacterium]
MKFITKFFILLALFLNLNSLSAYQIQGKVLNDKVNETIDSNIILSKKNNKINTWKKSLYIASGYGYPCGIRNEVGYNFENTSLAITLNIYDNWSNDPGEGMIGFLGKHFFEITNSKFFPYLLVNAGSTIAIFGLADSYLNILIGLQYPIDEWLYIRPEIGALYTSKSNYSNTDYIKEIKFGANISFEVIFARIF